MAHSYDLSGTDVEVQLLLRLLFDVDPSPEEVSLGNSEKDFILTGYRIRMSASKRIFLCLNSSVNDENYVGVALVNHRNYL